MIVLYCVAHMLKHCFSSRYMSKPGTELDLLRQLQIYEVVLQHEDGDNKSTPIRVDHSIR